MSHPLRVAFLAYHAYPVIEPAAEGVFGGTETRAWTLARALARRTDLAVSLVVYARRPIRQPVCQGVRIVRRHEPLYWVRQAVGRHVEILGRFPWVRFRSFSPGLLWQMPLCAVLRAFRCPPDPCRPDQFLQGLEADVLLGFGVHRQSAAAVATAKATGRRSVVFLGADSDLDPRYTPDSTYVSPYGERGAVCWYALHHADRIVVQTAWQQATLAERFGREALRLPNPIDLEAWDASQASEPSPPAVPHLPRYALWVGRADSFHKRPLLCLDVARRCPEVPFLLVVNPREPAVEEQLRRQRPGNVRLVERVPFADMPRVFRRAGVYVNTSAPGYEGFPNVFLQAAASRVPIASLELDADFVSRSGAGRVAGGDVQRLAEFVRRMWHHPAEASAVGQQGRRFVQQHHDAAKIVDRLAQALLDWR